MAQQQWELLFSNHRPMSISNKDRENFLNLLREASLSSARDVEIHSSADMNNFIEIICDNMNMAWIKKILLEAFPEEPEIDVLKKYSLGYMGSRKFTGPYFVNLLKKE